MGMGRHAGGGVVEAAAGPGAAARPAEDPGSSGALAPAEAAGGVLKALPMRPGFPRGLRVLVLDPDAGERMKAANLLREFKYEVQEAGTRRTALERLRSASKAGDPFEVVLACSQALGLAGEAPGRGGETPNSRGGDAFRAALGGAPLLLLVNEQKAADVVRGIRMGALHVLPKPLSQESAKTIWQHAVRRIMAEKGFRQGPVGVMARAKAATGGGKAKGKGASNGTGNGTVGGGVRKGGSKGKGKGKNPRPPSNFDPHAPPPFALSGAAYPLRLGPQMGEGAGPADMMPMFGGPDAFSDMLPGLEDEMAMVVGGGGLSSKALFGSGAIAGSRGAGGAGARSGGGPTCKKRKAAGQGANRGRALTKDSGQHPPPLAMKPSLPAGGLGGWGQGPQGPARMGYMGHTDGGLEHYGAYGAPTDEGLFGDVSDAKPSLGLNLKKTPSLLNLLGSPKREYTNVKRET